MVSRERACQAIGLGGALGIGFLNWESSQFLWSCFVLETDNKIGSREGDDESKDVGADVFCDLSDYKHSIPVVISFGAIPILVNLLSDGNFEVRERVSGAIAKLSYDEADHVALADAGAVPLMIDVFHEESEEAEGLRDFAKEALLNFSEDPYLRERISVTIDDLSFQRMEMIRRASKEQMVRSIGRMRIEQLTWDPDLV
ncbi:hypothetical protein QYF36_002835 [Acer negundo]|nr:hypothetical protein QYF36_002835 [Acer negundo]